MKKYLKWIIPFITGGVIVIYAYGQQANQVNNNTDDLVKLDEKVEEVEDDVDENATTNREQAIVLERTVKVLDELEKRVYKK